MKTDKQVKKEFRAKAQKQPEKHYPVSALKELGFHRNKCEKCGNFFWSTDENRSVCGDAQCLGGYQFIGSPNTKKKFDYIETWDAFKKFFRKKGYFEYKRYPVVARWRDDVYWVGASVYPFQPYVVSGEIKPKSNAVIIPQPSLRFNDIDNVGVTGSHYVCFDMLGQLHFEQAKDYDMETYWKEYFEWISKGMTVPEDEIVVHEDAWAGGGTFGPSMEFFSKGMEIGNQVYMQYQVEEGGACELDIKVLDMGQGHERVPWFSTGKSNSYETTFPTVAKYLYKLTGFKPDEELMQKFLPFSALLNLDEVEDVNKVWKHISKQTGYDVKKMKEKILPLVAIYSIGEHSRAALFALNDGALPSNVGGGYNLRTILRRAFGFADKNEWSVDSQKLIELHARFLKPMYPELSKNLKNVNEILESEKRKHVENVKRSGQIIESVLKDKKISKAELIELYDSHGVSPEDVEKEAGEKGISVKIPDDFYAMVSERHEQKESKLRTEKEKKIDLDKLPETEKLYWSNWKKTEFDAVVLKIIGSLVVLDRTGFYPTSGGQEHDTGELGGQKIEAVFTQNGHIIHSLSEKPLFKEGDKIRGIIDFERREQLTQHHTTAHLVNAVARELLGRHVWQAGAAKTVEKGRLDISHFENLSNEQLEKIEVRVNELVKKNIAIGSEILPREKAGRVQDGIVRINYVSGKAAEKATGEKSSFLEETAFAMGVSKQQVPARARELFSKWKKARKAVKKGKSIEGTELEPAKKVQKEELSDERLLEETARAFSTQPEHVARTAKRFMEELKGFRNVKKCKN